jgi:hypothetical protein
MFPQCLFMRAKFEMGNSFAQGCFQLEILSAKPGVVETSLKIEPYNCEFFHSFEGVIDRIRWKVNRVGVSAHYVNVSTGS